MSPQNPDTAYSNAQELLKAGQPDKALPLLFSICTQKNTKPAHWFLLGISQAETGNLAAATQSFSVSLRLAPGNIMVLASLARAYNGLQEYQKTVELLKPVSSISNNKLAALQMITAHIELNQLQQAEDICDELNSLAPFDIEVLLQYGLIKKLQNSFDEAIIFYDQVLAMQPDVLAALVNKGLSLQASSKVDDAITLFQEVLKQHADNDQVWHILALAWLANADLSEAIKCFEKAFSLNPMNVETGVQLAIALRHDARTQDCEIVCKKILQVAPDNAEALFFQDAYSKQSNNESLGRIPAELSKQMYKGKDKGKQFDLSLKKSLTYKAPDVLNQAVRDSIKIMPVSEDSQFDILELGCGSGLCGSRFSDIARTLIGTDISPDMLEAAKDKNAYTELYDADLIDALDNYNAVIDLIIAMDVLCFFGDLTDVFRRCHQALRSNGIFAFSVVKPKTDAVCELQIQGHFVHSLQHLEQVAELTGFKQIFVDTLPLRRELNEDQMGHVCLYQKI